MYMPMMTRPQFERWREQRKQGARSWILKWGVLTAGIPWGLFMSLVFAMILWFDRNDLLGALLVPLLFVPTGLLFGYLFGGVMWTTFEDSFHRSRNSDGSFNGLTDPSESP